MITMAMTITIAIASLVDNSLSIPIYLLTRMAEILH